MRCGAPAGPVWRPTRDWLPREVARGSPRGGTRRAATASAPGPRPGPPPLMRSWTILNICSLRSCSDTETDTRWRSAATGRYSSGSLTGRPPAPMAAVGQRCPTSRRLAKLRPTTSTNRPVDAARDPIRARVATGRGRPQWRNWKRRAASAPKGCWGAEAADVAAAVGRGPALSVTGYRCRSWKRNRGELSRALPGGPRCRQN